MHNDVHVQGSSHLAQTPVQCGGRAAKHPTAALSAANKSDEEEKLSRPDDDGFENSGAKKQHIYHQLTHDEGKKSLQLTKLKQQL